MKRLFSALSLVSVCALTAGGRPSSGQKVNGGDEGLNGAVRSVRVEVARVHKRGDSYVESDRAPSRAVAFDRQGRKTEETDFGPDGAASLKSIFSYNDRGQLTEVRRYRDGRYVGSTLYVYGGAGRLEEGLRRGANGELLDKMTYRYDAAGNKVESLNHLPDGTLLTKLVSGYDGSGRLSQMVLCGGSQGGGLIVRGGDKPPQVIPPDDARVAKGARAVTESLSASSLSPTTSRVTRPACSNTTAGAPS